MKLRKGVEIWIWLEENYFCEEGNGVALVRYYGCALLVITAAVGTDAV